MSATGSGSVDPTLLELFRAEVDTHLPVLSAGLLSLEKGQADANEINSMMRAAHSIKGAARIVGNEPAVRVAHILEDCFTAAKDGRVTLSSDSVDVLLEGVDALQRICSPEASPGIGDQSVEPVLEKIAALRDGKATLKPAAMVREPAGQAISLPARFDDTAAAAVQTQLCERLAASPSRITLDFADVADVSVAAMQLLLTLARHARGTSSALALEAIGVTASVRALFRVVGLEASLAMKD